MKIYLVRHGETDWNNEKRLQGWADISLNAKGVKEAEEVAEKLKNVHFDDAFCSDLERAEVTAETILKGRDIEVQMDPGSVSLGLDRLKGHSITTRERMNPSRFTNFSFIRINTSLNSAVNPLTISRLAPRRSSFPRWI